MTPRKAIYTDDELRLRRSAQSQQYNKSKTVLVNIRMLPEDKAIFEQYAAWKGERHLSRVFRNCVEYCMCLDGWTYNPDLKPEEVAPEESAE